MKEIIRKFINYFTDGRLSQNEQILWGLTFGVIVLMLSLVIIQSIRVARARKFNKLNAQNEAKYESEMEVAEETVEEVVVEEIHLKYLPIVAAEFGEVTHAIAQSCPCKFVESAKATIDDFKDDCGIVFIVNAKREVTAEDLASVSAYCEAQNFSKENILVGFNAEEYLANPEDYESTLALVKENGFGCALTNMGQIIDHNALVDFDFVTINRSFKEKYQNDSENMLHILAGGNAIKAIEVDSNEDVANIAQMGFFGPDSECEFPYFYSNNIYRAICADCLKTIKAIAQLPYLLPEEAFIDYSEVEVEDKVSEEPKEELPQVEETPAVEEAPKTEEAPVEETPVEETQAEEAQEEAEEAQEEFDFDNIKTKPFAVKMINTSEENKAWYNELKNALLKYEKVRPQYSKGGDGFKYKNKACAKIRIAGKTLRLYLDLNPLGYPQTKYHQKDVSDVKKYIRTPFMVKVKSDLGLRRALFLIDDMARIYAMHQIEGYENEDHMPELERLASIWEATHPEEV